MFTRDAGPSGGIAFGFLSVGIDCLANFMGNACHRFREFGARLAPFLLTDTAQHAIGYSRRTRRAITRSAVSYAL
jgi:hypothetical protein